MHARSRPGSIVNVADSNVASQVYGSELNARVHGAQAAKDASRTKDGQRKSGRRDGMGGYERLITDGERAIAVYRCCCGRILVVWKGRRPDGSAVCVRLMHDEDEDERGRVCS